MFLFAGCAYFNTFYYARKYYAEAETERAKNPAAKPSTQALDLYQKSMQKCAKLLMEHEGSGWVDDALLLMGKCSLKRGEYAQGIRKFEELIQFYPKSDLVLEARYLTGVALLEDRDAAPAVQALTEVLDDPKSKKFHADARYYLARAQLLLGDSLAAVTTSEQFLAGDVKNRWANAAAETLAAIHLARGEPALARAAYEQVKTDPRHDWPTYKSTRLAIARCLRLEGRHDEARAELSAVLVGIREAPDSAEVALELGYVAEAEGADSLAVELFARVPRRFPRTPSAARALHERGLILLDRFGDLQAAKTSFDSVSIHASGLVENGQAKSKADVLGQRIHLDERLAGRLQRLEAASAPVESSAVVPESVRSSGDSAMAVADSVRSSGDSAMAVADSTAPRGPIAFAGGPGDHPGNSAPASDSLGPLSNSDYLAALGPEGRHSLYVIADSSASDELAGTLVEIGQVELLKLGRTERALEAYEEVVADFADTRYAPQAMLATAWIREHRFGQREEAETLYRRILDEHPTSLAARAAAEALGVPYTGDEALADTGAVRVALEAELATARQTLAAARRAMEEEARAEAAGAAGGGAAVGQAAAHPDSKQGVDVLQPSSNQVMPGEDGFAGSPMEQLPPRVVTLATPNYPEDLARRGIEGDVIVEVVLASTGEIEDAHIIQSGNFELEEYALEAVHRSTFSRPGVIDRTTVTFHFPPVKELTEPDPNAPQVITNVTPEYPPDLAQRGVAGTVRVQVSVGPGGDVVQTQVVQSDNPELDPYAVEAARRMLFTPPRDVDQTVVTFHFPPEGG